MVYYRALRDRYEIARWKENQRLQREHEAKQKRLQDEANRKLQIQRDAEAKAQLIAAKLLRKADEAAP